MADPSSLCSSGRRRKKADGHREQRPGGGCTNPCLSWTTSLRQRGSRLIIRNGPTLEAIRELVKLSGATAVYWNRRYEPTVIDRDRRVKTSLRQDGLVAESFNSSLLFEPWTVRTQKGDPYQVFSAFWKACLAQPEPAPPEDAPCAHRDSATLAGNAQY